MEGAIQTLVKVYLKSSKGKENLGKKEFQNLVKGQLSNILSDTDSKEAINNMGQGLDANQDGKVGFEEYMKLIGYLAVSLSDQRTKEEPAQNAASGQVAQCTQDKEEKPEANAEPKEEAKPEANEEPKAEATAEIKVEANADGNIEVKVEAKPEVEIEPEAPKEESPAAAVVAATAVATAVEAAATAVEDPVKEEEKAGETEKVEDAAEKVVAAVGEEVEKKIDEATS
ncbi:S100 calcium binding protein U [Cheilinus undulatus]|uniref:S100 calcium binding protein U n=1 Tax=Cheilinus undulatus TaxID=241271 RepID=UPI001BD39E81|nr:S100 calcium binding protein U [Cheilinus undulatus]